MSGKTTFFTSVGDQTIPVTPTAIGDGTLPGSFKTLDAQAMTTQTVAALSSAQLAGPQPGYFTTATMTTATIAALTTTSMNAIAVAPSSTLTTSQIAALTTTQLGGLTTTNIIALNALFVAKLGAP